MKLTLGQAAKEVDVSKTALSNAIKNGRLSANRSDIGSYEIDPAELFRVYPPKTVNKGERLTALDPQVDGVNVVNGQVLTAQLTGYKALLDEKDKQIERMIREKEKLEEMLVEQTQQAKRITLLLENKSVGSGGGEWQQAIKALEERIVNKESEAQKEHEEMKKKAAAQISKYKKELEEEKTKPFWKKLFR